MRGMPRPVALLALRGVSTCDPVEVADHRQFGQPAIDAVVQEDMGAVAHRLDAGDQRKRIAAQPRPGSQTSAGRVVAKGLGGDAADQLEDRLQLRLDPVHPMRREAAADVQPHARARPPSQMSRAADIGLPRMPGSVHWVPGWKVSDGMKPRIRHALQQLAASSTEAPNFEPKS
jgi:hypothetical protein